MTNSRLHQWAASKNLSSATTSTGSVVIAFNRVTVSLKQEGTTFRVFAVWRATPRRPEQITALRAAANDINSRRLEPKAYVIDEQKMFVMESVTYSGDGMTDQQLDSFLVGVFSAVFSCTDQLDNDFPDLSAPGDTTDD
ncbi:YbjN domain-containing protein [Corynebacterium mendelii]|uniref:YbjN domain-containing protein n=1 Tax=Corynebacterium mendelii TaxID=2765362 RepID=A0A939IXS4_9CORY|nr:YbjN domain-containing protein [Corynebacterium mendelii]MBN9643957.1 YbjN domain-containing protein [Corynebacterium mendelii]